uniref:Uncharacterized protein n=1 Tax=Trichobilharzia regenti TaxID=157069 RepID=A0AA85JPD2_TRIRE|nr:unnamed protein product [Trichobilharzia regenti]
MCSSSKASGKHFVSFSAASLYTNVPFKETIDFICDVANDCHIHGHYLRKLLNMCTKEVHLMNNGHFQIDGEETGSLLGSLFADILLVILEYTVLKDYKDEAGIYLWLMYNIFPISKYKTEAKIMLKKFNSRGASIEFK